MLILSVIKTNIDTAFYLRELKKQSLIFYLTLRIFINLKN